MPKDIQCVSNLPVEAFFALTQEQIIDGIPTSANPWQELWKDLGLPDDPTGLRMLDVGGGASDLTAELLERGADAFAIDPRYKSKWLVDRSAKNFFNAVRQRDPVKRSYLDENFATLKRMLCSMESHPDRYLAGLSTDIPFESDSFDLVFSSDCITVQLDLNYDLLSQSVSECLRVVKPGGEVRIAPIGFISPGLPSEVSARKISNQSRVVNELDKNINALAEPLDDSSFRLILKKPIK